jgi:hypothetical protein
LYLVSTPTAIEVAASGPYGSVVLGKLTYFDVEVDEVFGSDRIPIADWVIGLVGHQ